MFEKIIKSIYGDYKFLILYGFLIIVAYGFHMSNLTLYGDDKWTTSESERLIRLPMYYKLNDDRKTVIDTVKRFFNE